MRVYLDTEAAAARLNLSPKTLRMQAAKGKLPSYKISPRRMVFAEDDLITYEEEHRGRYGIGSPDHPLHVAGNDELTVARAWADAFITHPTVPFNLAAFERLCVQITPFLKAAIRTAPPEDFPRLFQIAVILHGEGRPIPKVSQKAALASEGVFKAADQFYTVQALERRKGKDEREEEA